MNIDTVTFILEVKQRPALWDPSNVDYGNKAAKDKLWMEITDIFSGTEFSTPSEKHVLCTYLLKKWRNIKDCYTRENRRLYGDRNSPAAKRKRPYEYYSMLSFLSRVNTNNDSYHEEFPDTKDWTLSSDIQMSSRIFGIEIIPKKTRFEDSVKQEVIIPQNYTDIPLNCDVEISEDEDRLFMLSLVKDFKKIPEHMKLTVKRKIINVLEEAHLQMNTYSNTVDSTETCLYSNAPATSTTNEKSDRSNAKRRRSSHYSSLYDI